MLPLPKTPFDPRPAIARLQTGSTDTLRELHPDLAWMWDEVDDLWDEVDERVRGYVKALNRVFNNLTDMMDDIDKMQPVDPNPLVDIRTRLDALVGYVDDARNET